MFYMCLSNSLRDIWYQNTKKSYDSVDSVILHHKLRHSMTEAQNY